MQHIRTCNMASREQLRSWIPVPDNSDFPIQNLPYGIFSTSTDSRPRIGVAIGDQILDLKAACKLKSLSQTKAGQTNVLQKETLNDFMELGKDAWNEVRRAVQSLLSGEDPALRDDKAAQAQLLVKQAEAVMHLPAHITDYTDFYACEEHARNATAIMRTGIRILLPNWLHLPVAYHGRASSVVVSGTDIHRPRGQVLKPPTKGNFVYNFYQSWFGKPETAQEACGKLDFELEMACLTGPSTRLGESVPVEKADDFIFGMVLMNDWSARDFQKWEMMPLGPFNGKNFATSISPWVVPLQALQPFRAGKEQSPVPLPYLRENPRNLFDIKLQVALQPEGGEETIITETNSQQLHWSMNQMLAHHTYGGCRLRSGDLLGTGTVSSSVGAKHGFLPPWAQDLFLQRQGPTGGGCLLELSWGGTRDVKLKDGSSRHFLHDGDRVTLKGYCQGNGHRIGFGQCTGKVLPARSL